MAKKTICFEYTEKRADGGYKSSFTYMEAMTIVKGYPKTHTATGRFGYKPNDFRIERYYGRFGDGWKVSHGDIKGEWHIVDYYTKPITEDSTPPNQFKDKEEFVLT